MLKIIHSFIMRRSKYYIEFMRYDSKHRTKLGTQHASLTFVSHYLLVKRILCFEYEFVSFYASRNPYKITKLTVTQMSFSCYHCEMKSYLSVKYPRLIHTAGHLHWKLPDTITNTGDTVTEIVSRKEVRRESPLEPGWTELAWPHLNTSATPGLAASVGTTDSGLGGRTS